MLVTVEAEPRLDALKLLGGSATVSSLLFFGHFAKVSMLSFDTLEVWNVKSTA